MEVLTGQPFDLETFKHLPLYFYLGDQDDNWDSQDVSTFYHFLGETYQDRWPVAAQIYTAVGCNSLFVMYPNVDHSITLEMTDHVRDFFLNHSPLDVEAFVARFYQQCLSREADEGGLDYWTTSLLFGTRTGADVAKGFIFSQEFLNKNVGDDAYLRVLYKAFFDRDPDSGGYDYWSTRLRSGESRSNVLDGFVYAQEFANLCDRFDVLRFRDRTPVIAFVTRFYQQCLTREPDAGGLDYWVNSLLDGTRTGADVAFGFVFSQEFINRGADNATYLTILYRAFFDRDPDSGGYTYWLDKLNRQESRESVLNGFLGAQEFFNLCDQYGIIPQ